MSKHDDQFSKWMDNELSNEQINAMEKELAQDPLWQQRLETAKQAEFLASNSLEHEMPEWDRTSMFEQEHKPWWQWQGIPALSMAFSCFALALVIFKVEFTMSEQGMLVSFGGNSHQQQEQLAKLVDDKMATFNQQQQLALANFTADLSTKQQESNLQLASYIMDTSRQERKEDMSDFISYFNEQRKDEQLTQRIKYQRLEDAIQYQAGFLNNSTNIQPANWMVEE